jgi:hypothetical protein
MLYSRRRIAFREEIAVSYLKWAIVLVAGALCARGASAGDTSGGGPWNNYWRDWHRNNCWMEPFVYPDRASVWNFNSAQIAKGWQAQCMLGDPHFEPDGSKLSPAGINKLKMILQTGQPHPVFVERAWSEDTTVKRLEAAQQAVATLSRGPTEVLVSNMPLTTTPADQVNGVNTWFTGYMRSIPVPKPTAFQDDAAGSGGP